MILEHWDSLQSWGTVLQIFLVNLALSGDNAMVIALAAHRLPAAQRRQAIWWGGGLAILLRIVFTLLAAWLLHWPGLLLVGGLVLFGIAFKLMADEQDSEPGDDKQPTSLRDAVLTIFVADVVMSLDNILAVAGASGGEFSRMLLGLALSIGFIVFCSQLIATVMNRCQWLVYVGAAVLFWTAAEMVMSSREVAALFTHSQGICLNAHWEKWMVTQAPVDDFDLTAPLPGPVAQRVEYAPGRLVWLGPMTATERDVLLARAQGERSRLAIEDMYAEARADTPPWFPSVNQSVVAPLFTNKWVPEVWQRVRENRYPGAALVLQFLAAGLCVSVGLRQRRRRGAQRAAEGANEPTGSLQPEFGVASGD